MRRVLAKFLQDYAVGRQHDRAAAVFGGLHDLARFVGHVAFAQRFADFHTLGEQECVSHAAAEEQHINLAHEVVENRELR